MARVKSEFLKAAGTMWEIWQAIVNAVMALGGNDDSMRRLLTDKSLVRRVAELIVESSKSVYPTYRVVVNYTHTLAEMIKAGKYDYANSDINAKNFPVSGAGTRETEIALFHFNKNMSSGQVIAEMEKAGYRPAKIEELLALAEFHPELQREFPIIALGSVWRSPVGDLNVPYLNRYDSRRGLRLDWFGGGWGDGCRFATARK